jgi:hypothetical protein
VAQTCWWSLPADRVIDEELHAAPHLMSTSCWKRWGRSAPTKSFLPTCPLTHTSPACQRHNAGDCDCDGVDAGRNDGVRGAPREVVCDGVDAGRNDGVRGAPREVVCDGVDAGRNDGVRRAPREEVTMAHEEPLLGEGTSYMQIGDDDGEGYEPASDGTPTGGYEPVGACVCARVWVGGWGACVCACVRARACVCVCVCVYLCLCLCMCLCMCLCVCVCVCVCVHLCVLVRTHARTSLCSVWVIVGNALVITTALGRFVVVVAVAVRTARTGGVAMRDKTRMSGSAGLRNRKSRYIANDDVDKNFFAWVSCASAPVRTTLPHCTRTVVLASLLHTSMTDDVTLFASCVPHSMSGDASTCIAFLWLLCTASHVFLSAGLVLSPCAHPFVLLTRLCAGSRL